MKWLISNGITKYLLQIQQIKYLKSYMHDHNDLYSIINKIKYITYFPNLHEHVKPKYPDLVNYL